MQTTEERIAQNEGVLKQSAAKSNAKKPDTSPVSAVLPEAGAKTTQSQYADVVIDDLSKYAVGSLQQHGYKPSEEASSAFLRVFQTLLKTMNLENLAQFNNKEKIDKFVKWWVKGQSKNVEELAKDTAKKVKKTKKTK
jgi:hypothetical protein